MKTGQRGNGTYAMAIFLLGVSLLLFGIFGHIWHIWVHIWARAIWSSGVSLKRSCKMQFRRVGLRSIGPSSQKLWPNQIFGRFPHCNYNVKLKMVTDTSKSLRFQKTQMFSQIIDQKEHKNNRYKFEPATWCYKQWMSSVYSTHLFFHISWGYWFSSCTCTLAVL